jgi:hypothetical protein
VCPHKPFHDLPLLVPSGATLFKLSQPRLRISKNERTGSGQLREMSSAKEAVETGADDDSDSDGLDENGQVKVSHGHCNNLSRAREKKKRGIAAS